MGSRRLAVVSLQKNAEESRAIFCIMQLVALLSIFALSTVVSNGNASCAHTPPIVFVSQFPDDRPVLILSPNAPQKSIIYAITQSIPSFALSSSPVPADS